MKEHGGLAQRSAVNGSGSTQRSSTHCRFDPSAIANQSEKYQYILECVHNSGFADFDDMVVGYYTSAFARGSLADRAQKTSRARRLQSMLSQLYRCSQGWTTWEARGIQAEIVAAAEEIYVADFHRLAADLGPFPTEQLEEVKNSRSDAVLNGGNLEAGVLGDLRQLYQNKVRRELSR